MGHTLRRSWLLPMLLSTQALALLSCSAVMAQSRAQAQAQKYDRSAVATVIHEANVYVAADAQAQRVSLVTPGHEVVIVERNGPWVKVFANTDVNDDEDEDDRNKPVFSENATVTPASGWIRDKGIIGPPTPSGDLVLFGAAANFEDEASKPHAPKDAAASAQLLYRRVAEYYPDSALAAQASWRAADIRWQLDKQDVSTLPSAKEQEAYLRPQIFDGALRKVEKLYPATPYAEMAAYDLLDNKLCGDWQGLPKCPEMETGLYTKYAQQFPDGPRTAEALYNAVYRQGVLVTMYTVQEDRKRAEAAAQKTQSLAENLKAKFPNSDYAARAASIAFRVSQGIPVYGSDRD